MKNPVYVNTVPATLTLDFERGNDKNFRGTAAFTGAKTLELRSEADADAFIFHFEITTSAVITCPSNFVAETTENRFASNDLTLTGSGTYSIVAIYDGANWKLKATTDGGFA